MNIQTTGRHCVYCKLTESAQTPFAFVNQGNLFAPICAPCYRAHYTINVQEQERLTARACRAQCAEMTSPRELNRLLFLKWRLVTGHTQPGRGSRAFAVAMGTLVGAMYAMHNASGINPAQVLHLLASIH